MRLISAAKLVFTPDYFLIGAWERCDTTPLQGARRAPGAENLIYSEHDARAVIAV